MDTNCTTAAMVRSNAPSESERLKLLSSAAAGARARYAARIASGQPGPWWTAVVVTASSEQQAEYYRAEIERRFAEGRLPRSALYMVAPDPGGNRLGSGGATLNALRELAGKLFPAGSSNTGDVQQAWASQRVLMIHAGGDLRRLPQYALRGRLFSALPLPTPWGDASTIFDEILTLSAAWVERISSGLVISPGDVLAALDASQWEWNMPGITAVAVRQPLEVAIQHGVYAVDESGNVYSFLHKPSIAEMRAAGAILPNGMAALDTGLLAFDASSAARLCILTGSPSHGGSSSGNPDLELPYIDLYQHVIFALTGQWTPDDDAHPMLRRLAQALHGIPFRCLLVEGHFEHFGGAADFRRAISEGSDFLQLYAAQRRIGSAPQPGLESAGAVIDSVLAGGGKLDTGAVAIECNLEFPVYAARGAILQGLHSIPAPVQAPEDTVIHQLPLHLGEGRSGCVILAYGVEDDPQLPASAATWFGRPLLQVLEDLGISPAQVWPETPVDQRSLWNAELFVVGVPSEAWSAAQWLMGLPSSGFDALRWASASRVSLATAQRSIDVQALQEARIARMRSGWQRAALTLARAEADLRPMLALSPGIAALAGAARFLSAEAVSLEESNPTHAASRHFQASLFYGQAGLVDESESSRTAAFRCVRMAVERGVSSSALLDAANQTPLYDEVLVCAPPRIDFGGGWSDTPPFCLDWGGAVLNMALELGGGYPIRVLVRRLQEPVLRCVADGLSEEWAGPEALLAPSRPGSPFAIHRAALQMLGWNRGGLEIQTMVELPMGSGLGSSSILAAAMLRALATLFGLSLTEAGLSDQVMCLEQRMTTGGGWQDQAGGIFPGVKLITSGPGLIQRLRVQPIGWTLSLQEEFYQRFVLYYTGIRRIAKDLLAQVVGSYLAREAATVQVIHSIKTLAIEMSYAMREGEWAHLGRLMQRHWELNQILDPHTTNAPINRLLQDLKPYLAGAKLAGAGGGGFLMLLAKDPEAAGKIRQRLATGPGKLFEYRVATEGLRVQTRVRSD